MRGKRIQITLKAGHHRPASETPFKWGFAGRSLMAKYWILAWSFVVFQWIWISIVKKPYFCDLSGGPDPLPPPLWIRACYYTIWTYLREKIRRIIVAWQGVVHASMLRDMIIYQILILFIMQLKVCLILLVFWGSLKYWPSIYEPIWVYMIKHVFVVTDQVRYKSAISAANTS